MLQIKSINIADPCNQSWQQMAEANGGRHCEQCCKTVTDFTSMTNQEIIVYFSLTTNVCGRFYDGQLAQLNGSLNLPKPVSKLWKRMGIAAFVALLFATVKADAQVSKPTPTYASRQIKARKPHRDLVQPDSLYCKTRTPTQINITTKTKIDISMEVKIPETLTAISGTLGGVQVQAIQIQDSSYSFYLSLRELFR